MRTPENNKAPRISVEADGHHYRVNLGTLEDFITQTNALLGENVYDFEYMCTALRRHVLLSSKHEHTVAELPDLLLLLDEVNLLLKDLVTKEVN